MVEIQVDEILKEKIIKLGKFYFELDPCTCLCNKT